MSNPLPKRPTYHTCAHSNAGYGYLAQLYRYNSDAKPVGIWQGKWHPTAEEAIQEAKDTAKANGYESQDPPPGSML